MAINNPTASAPYVSGSPNTSIARIACRIQINSTSAPNFVMPAGAVTTPVRTSAGLFTVVVPNFLKLGTLISFQGSILGAIGVTTGIIVQATGYVASTGVLTFTTYSLANPQAAADPTDDDWVCLDLVFAQDIVNEGTTAALA